MRSISRLTIWSAISWGIYCIVKSGVFILAAYNTFEPHRHKCVCHKSQTNSTLAHFLLLLLAGMLCAVFVFVFMLLLELRRASEQQQHLNTRYTWRSLKSYLLPLGVYSSVVDVVATIFIPTLYSYLRRLTTRVSYIQYYIVCCIFYVWCCMLYEDDQQ